MARVVIFGAGRGAETAYRYLSQDSDHEVCAFAVEAAYITGKEFKGRPIVPYESVAASYPPSDYHFFVPLGFQQMNALRAAKYRDAKRKGYRFISYVNSRNYSLEPPHIGENCFILDNQIFNLDVTIGDNVTIWSGNHIGDRTVVGNDVWISSQVTLTGDVTVGDGCFLGVNACVSNHVTLGPRTFVGASTVVSQDTAAGSVYVAQPPREIKMSSEKFLAMLKIT